MKIQSIPDRQLAFRDARSACATCHSKRKAARAGRHSRVAAGSRVNGCKATVLSEAFRVSRRDLGLGLGASFLALTSEATAAGLPFLQGAGSSYRFPEPVKFPRSKLDQRFAVLLVRSVYEAVDRLDFIPMSDFQAKFWKLRQSQYEPYLQQYAPLQIRQGDLQDPLYFDFISFAQIATIEEEIPRGRQVFEEYCEECPEQKRVVTRNPLYKDNASLPLALQQQAGDGIFQGLRDGFREEVFGGPPARPGAHIEQLAEDVQRILNIFVEKGYALKASVNNVSSRCSQGSCEVHGAHGSEGSFELRLEGPANLWGLGALSNSNSKLNNAFCAMAVEAYLRASGVRAEYVINRMPSSVVQQWKLA